MSMISEQVKELRIAAVYKEHSLKKLLEQAADTIEALSAKLQVANCGGLIPCKERLPQKDETVLIYTGIGYTSRLLHILVMEKHFTRRNVEVVVL